MESNLKFIIVGPYDIAEYYGPPADVENKIQAYLVTFLLWDCYWESQPNIRPVNGFGACKTHYAWLWRASSDSKPRSRKSMLEHFDLCTLIATRGLGIAELPATETANTFRPERV